MENVARGLAVTVSWLSWFIDLFRTYRKSVFVKQLPLLVE